MPEVSVIIPNYNHAAYLQERIDSVLNQTLQNFELIILDDRSTDNSREIIEQYRTNPKISHIVYNKKNSGNTFKQWEKGLSLAKGSLVWIAESDDSMQPSFLEIAVHAFHADASVGIFRCGSEWVNVGGEWIDGDQEGSGNNLVDGKEFILNNMVNGNSIYNASAVVFKKELVQLPLPVMITSLKYCGDWLFWIEILQRSKLFFLNQNLNSFRRHPQNVSGKAHKDGLLYLEGIKVYGYIKKCYPAHFKFIDNNDKGWAYRFMARKYSLKITLRFIFNSLKAGIFIPVYILWFKIKAIFTKPIE